MEMEKIENGVINQSVEEPVEVIEEIKEEPITEIKEEKINNDTANSTISNEAVAPKTGTSNFDSLFDNLYSDVAGANNFISSLIEQKKNVGINEAYLEEEKAKLDKAKQEFNDLMMTQKESIELKNKRLEENEKAQKLRMDQEQAAFAEETEGTRKSLELEAETNKNESARIAKDKEEFAKYKAAEEEALKLANAKLEMEQAEFAKYKEIEESKIETAKNKNQLDRETFEKENANAQERIRLANEELENSRQEFEKYKEVEKQKLELESKNLSQSCARFKELVSQFNSGFSVLPDEN
jgi:hypothetical protein